jgi:hypothetical protein
MGKNMKKRFYADYREWEDYKNGMWGKEVKLENVEKSRLLLITPLEAMAKVIIDWPIATKHNLSNAGSNRKSWVGQACCCLNHGATEFETRMAWKELTKEQQFEANRCADVVIKHWELKNNFKYVKEDFTL